MPSLYTGYSQTSITTDLAEAAKAAEAVGMTLAASSPEATTFTQVLRALNGEEVLLSVTFSVDPSTGVRELDASACANSTDPSIRRRTGITDTIAKGSNTAQNVFKQFCARVLARIVRAAAERAAALKAEGAWGPLTAESLVDLADGGEAPPAPPTVKEIKPVALAKVGKFLPLNQAARGQTKLDPEWLSAWIEQFLPAEPDKRIPAVLALVSQLHLEVKLASGPVGVDVERRPLPAVDPKNAPTTVLELMAQIAPALSSYDLNDMKQLIQEVRGLASPEAPADRAQAVEEVKEEAAQV